MRFYTWCDQKNVAGENYVMFSQIHIELKKGNLGDTICLFGCCLFVCCLKISEPENSMHALCGEVFSLPSVLECSARASRIIFCLGLQSCSVSEQLNAGRV